LNKIIDVAIVFDIQALNEKYRNASRNPNAPTAVDHDDACLVAAMRNVPDLATQATADLALTAIKGDTVRWRTLSFPGGGTEHAVIYRLQRFAGLPTTGAAEPKLARAWRALPRLQADGSVDPRDGEGTRTLSYRVDCPVTGTGMERYQVWFYLAKGSNSAALSIQGYFYWDPSITIYDHREQPAYETGLA
jgi:hypothetical protein